MQLIKGFELAPACNKPADIFLFSFAPCWTSKRQTHEPLSDNLFLIFCIVQGAVAC